MSGPGPVVNEADVALLAAFLSAKRNGRDCVDLARRLLTRSAEAWLGVALPDPPAMSGPDEGAEMLGDDARDVVSDVLEQFYGEPVTNAGQVLKALAPHVAALVTKARAEETGAAEAKLLTVLREQTVVLGRLRRQSGELVERLDALDIEGAVAQARAEATLGATRETWRQAHADRDRMVERFTARLAAATAEQREATDVLAAAMGLGSSEGAGDHTIVTLAEEAAPLIRTGRQAQAISHDQPAGDR